MKVNRRARTRAERCEAGFTLVELIVAMVILATLAAIAIPSYSLYVLKSHRTEAKSALLDLASLEERYFSTANTYSSNPTDLGYNAAGTPFPVGSGWYNITTLTATAAVAPTALIPGGTPATYTITATAVGQQANDATCATFTINSAGQQTATSANCWQN
ncbi:MAG: type IV pilin protein [Steroidobacteraceae bacterium]|jgi:type IV pilus assembly protein PilE